MAEGPQLLSVVNKISGCSYLGLKLSPTLHMYSDPEHQIVCGSSSPFAVARLQAMPKACRFNNALCPIDLIGGHSLVPTTIVPVFVPAPREKGFTGFFTDFLMGGVSAAISKTCAAPIERVKLLIQNQDEMLKSGRLSEPYKGIGQCFARTIHDEGFLSLWRGNFVNVLRYFPTQVMSLVQATLPGWSYYLCLYVSGSSEASEQTFVASTCGLGMVVFYIHAVLHTELCTH